MHAFYPLISYEIETVKISKDETGSIRKKPKIRPIKYAAHIDSHIYAYYTYQLSKSYETKITEYGLNESILAFRSLGKGNIEFANQAFEDIKKQMNCVAVALDVTGFFDNLDHLILKQAWANVIDCSYLPDDHFNVFKSLTEFSEVALDEVYCKLGISKHNSKKGRFKLCDAATFRNLIRGSGIIKTNSQSKGIPQGSPLSALLSNIYMLEFDKWAKEVINLCSGHYYRYCDDILFIVPEEVSKEIESRASLRIQDLRLSINPDKTEIRKFWTKGTTQFSNKPLQYLGFTFDGRSKLLRSAALARYSGKMKSGVRQAMKKRNKENLLRLEQGIPIQDIYRKKLYKRYSHLSNRNFITYGHRAAKIMGSSAIRKQLKPLWSRLQKEIEKANKTNTFPSIYS
ncbi:hypothetical protein GCM10007876_24310 [Litoribrevibacter albus]|uniref:Reverse transcriptase domain-containing protein n=2 Tax=Litoribrevibacter albus TaxID=1473156 RepID=A0AA37SCN6_9GAMM|nr:hypothetical protein GCM10007876_24310 [Litoribrevibacter albus]